MKRFALAILGLVAACGEKTTEPPPMDPGPGSQYLTAPKDKFVPLRDPWMRSTEAVDIQSAGPVKFERVQLIPIAEGTSDGIQPVPGVFSVKYTPKAVDAKAITRIQVRALCRIGTTTHAIVDFRGPHALDGTEVDSTINIQPYTDAPTVCQLDWFGAAPADMYPTTVLATACYQRDAGTIETGACPSGALPPNQLPAETSAAFHILPGTMKLDGAVFSYNALITAGASVDVNQIWRTRMRCDDGKILRTTTVDSEALPAHTMLLPPGASMFVVDGTFFAKVGAPDARCELLIATGESKVARVRATYCLANDSTPGALVPGACSPALRAK